MSAYVTYKIQPVDVFGVVLDVIEVRAVCKPAIDQAYDIAKDQLGNIVGAVKSVERSVPAKIGRVTAPCKTTFGPGGSRAKVLQVR